MNNCCNWQGVTRVELNIFFIIVGDVGGYDRKLR